MASYYSVSPEWGWSSFLLQNGPYYRVVVVGGVYGGGGMSLTIACLWEAHGPEGGGGSVLAFPIL